MNSIEFPKWFSLGCYCGLVCCMCAIAVNALYCSVRRRGTTRQLAGVIVICVISALFLLCAFLWYSLRFNAGQAFEQGTLSSIEIGCVLGYVALCGWLLPVSVTAFYCLFASPRNSMASAQLPRIKQNSHLMSSGFSRPLLAFFPLAHKHKGNRSAPPLAFGEDTPWGWLAYDNGRFQGQQLALKRAIVTIGRGEENDIWLDDEMASRVHAELAWKQGRVSITDRDSLNGVLLNGRRIRGSAIVEHEAVLEIGAQRFVFEKAEHSLAFTEKDDPLLRHVWHSLSHFTQSDHAVQSVRRLVAFSSLARKQNKTLALMNDASHQAYQLLGRQAESAAAELKDAQLPHSTLGDTIPEDWQDTEELDQISSSPVGEQTVSAVPDPKLPNIVTPQPGTGGSHLDEAATIPRSNPMSGLMPIRLPSKPKP